MDFCVNNMCKKYDMVEVMMMDNNSKIQTGIFGFITLAVLVLSIITMAVCFSLQSDLKQIANPESDFRERPYDLLQTAFGKKD